MRWRWEEIEPFYQELSDRSIDAGNVDGWLRDWSHLSRLIYERFQRIEVAVTVDTTDRDAEKQYTDFLDEIFPRAQAMEQKLKEKLLESGLQPKGFEIPLRNMRAEADLFRAENLPLISEEMKVGTKYDKIVGAQTVEWEGQELTIPQIAPLMQKSDRSQREQLWRLAMKRQIQDRQTVNELWIKLLNLRFQLARNADKPDYRAYRWQELLRLDYTPEDTLRFHEAIEQVVVPAAQRVYERNRQRLGVDELRPWDLFQDLYPLYQPPLPSYGSVDNLIETTGRIFYQVDPKLGEYFQTMRDEGLLDLPNRKNKAPGGYCTDFPVAQRPFIFMNAVGVHDDIQTLLHEGGHAFHVFESNHLPYFQQQQVGSEFSEVASMGMELLAGPYLGREHGGFYEPREAARARIQHLEQNLLFWPYMSVVDSFQHWVYTHPEEAVDPARCDACWGELWDRFITGVNWDGLEEEKVTGWHRKLHIFRYPFYYIEYGLAQLGAMQVWANALQDQRSAVATYRRALSLGGTVPLPQLFQAAGAKLAFDAETLSKSVQLAEQTIEELEQFL